MFMSNQKKILQKISDKTITLGIIGLGYVGLPLAVTFARNGVTVLGFENNEKKTALVNAGRNYITDISDADLETAVNKTKKQILWQKLKTLQTRYIKIL
jgi:UDP-N-acetyl-D-glucosamine dehydrogenase